MKKLLALIFLTPTLLMGQGFPELNLPTQIEEVTVYLNGAQVNRSGEIVLPAGESVVIAKGLTPNLNDQSIQVKAQGAFTLLAVNHQVNYLLDLRGKDQKVDSLRGELARVEDLITMQHARQKILDEKANLLDANKKLGGEDAGVSVTQLQQAMKYYEEELLRMATDRMASVNEVKLLEREKSKIEKQLREWNSRARTPSGEVLIRVRAEKSTRANFAISYLAYNAGWSPQYDIRVIDINSPVAFNYKAEVHQNTGVDWENVKLSFSNGNPNQSGAAPQLATWYLGFYEPYSMLRGRTKGVSVQPSSAPLQEVVTEEIVFEEASSGLAQADMIQTNVQEGATTVKFEVPIPYTVVSNGDRFSIDLNQHQLEAVYQYYAVPKVDKDAFLIARVIDWGQLNLLSGNASLYFEDTYVGKSYLDATNLSDTLDLSLGRDRSIIIDRERIDQFSKKRTIGASLTETRGWKLTARNNKSQPVSLVVFDQVPVSTSNEIEVEVISVSDGRINKPTGEVTWKMEIESQQSREWELQYEVKYPKKKKVILE